MTPNTPLNPESSRRARSGPPVPSSDKDRPPGEHDVKGHAFRDEEEEPAPPPPVRRAGSPGASWW